MAQICRKALIFSLTIVILEEIESADDFTAFQHYQKRPKNDVPISSKFEATTEKVLIPMIQCVKLKYNTILSFINKKLRSWSFYDGIGYEVSILTVANFISFTDHTHVYCCNVINCRPFNISSQLSKTSRGL